MFVVLLFSLYFLFSTVCVYFSGYRQQTKQPTNRKRIKFENYSNKFDFDIKIYFKVKVKEKRKKHFFKPETKELSFC